MRQPKRVFISHTSEFTKFPEGKSFIDAAIAAVNRAGHVPYDMGYFTARDQKSSDYCKEQVRECDVYVGVIGFRYGSPVRDRPEVSYTELEFEAASEDAPKTRLVFELDPIATVPVGLFNDQKFGDRQMAFRERIQEAGVICAHFREVHELEMLIHQALVDSIPSKLKTPQLKTIKWPNGKSPYPGLVWFDKEYAPLYFGRDQEVDDVVAKMSEPQGRFLLISGASGSGKSSLVDAGLWQALVKEGRLPGSQQWRWLRITPSADSRGPFVSLASELKRLLKITMREDDLAISLAKHTTTIGTMLAPHLLADQEVLLFVDQLEELYTQGFNDEHIQRFLEYIVASARDPQNRVRVISTIRSEFIGKLEESEVILKVLNAGYSHHVGPVSPRMLQEMIEKPAQRTKCKFEPPLVEKILDEAGKEPGSLPLVAYTLKQLFEKKQGRTFTREAYHAIGGVIGAIGTKADEVLKTLGSEAGRSFDRVFAELVHLEPEGPPTRKRAPLSVFQDDAGATQFIQKLAGSDCRILVTSGDKTNATVEVAHEKLFTTWPKLKEWIGESAEALRLIENSTERARQWRDRGDRAEELWLPQQVREVVNALLQYGKIPTPDLDRFLNPQQVLLKQLQENTLSHQQRAIIGWKLEQFADPRPGVGLGEDGLPDIAWIEIPGGHIQLEIGDDSFEIKPFRLAKYPVTNRQFQAFIDDGGYQSKLWWKGIKKELSWKHRWNEANCPRETVSWYEAVAFCHWLSHRLGTRIPIRLPTEWEWQQAAKGGDPTYKYPWGKEWDATRCNSIESRLNRTTFVGLYPSGGTPQGAMDMGGNVWEWCLNTYNAPSEQAALRINISSKSRVIRGGSFYNGSIDLRSSVRYGHSANCKNLGLGFRLAQDILPPEKG